MFKRIKNFFKKKKQPASLSGIHIYVEDSGEIYADISMADESEKSIESLASLLSMFSPKSFFQVSSIIRLQLESSDRLDLYVKIIEKSAGLVTFNQEDINKEYDEKPCINPSDMI